MSGFINKLDNTQKETNLELNKASDFYTWVKNLDNL